MSTKKSTVKCCRKHSPEAGENRSDREHMSATANDDDDDGDSDSSVVVPVVGCAGERVVLL
jgi:hypothetical protein